jgi:hypothetical protein
VFAWAAVLAVNPELLWYSRAKTAEVAIQEMRERCNKAKAKATPHGSGSNISNTRARVTSVDLELLSCLPSGWYFPGLWRAFARAAAAHDTLETQGWAQIMLLVFLREYHSHRLDEMGRWSVAPIASIMSDDDRANKSESGNGNGTTTTTSETGNGNGNVPPGNGKDYDNDNNETMMKVEAKADTAGEDSKKDRYSDSSNSTETTVVNGAMLLREFLGLVDGKTGTTTFLGPASFASVRQLVKMNCQGHDVEQLGTLGVDNLGILLAAYARQYPNCPITGDITRLFASCDKFRKFANVVITGELKMGNRLPSLLEQVSQLQLLRFLTLWAFSLLLASLSLFLASLASFSFLSLSLSLFVDNTLTRLVSLVLGGVSDALKRRVHSVVWTDSSAPGRERAQRGRSAETATQIVGQDTSRSQDWHQQQQQKQ